MKNKPVMSMTVRELLDAGYNVNISSHMNDGHDEAADKMTALTGTMGGVTRHKGGLHRWYQYNNPTLKLNISTFLE